MSRTSRQLAFLVGFLPPALCPTTALAGSWDGGNGYLTGAGEALLVGACLVVVLAFVVAAAELGVHLAHERRGDDNEIPVLSPLLARRLYGRALYWVAPAAVATSITLIRNGGVSEAAALLVAMLLTSAILRDHRRPLHLMPVARYAFNLFVPTAGIGVALLPGLFGQPLIDGPTAIAALAAAGATTVMGVWLEQRFEVDTPIRLGAIGPASFAGKLASELTDTGTRGYRVVGHLGDDTDADPRARWLGPLADVRAAVQRDGIDLLVVSPENPRMQVFEHTAQACLDLPVRVIEATALYEDVLGHVPIGSINSAWFQFIMHPRFSPSSPLSKRVLDLLISALLLTAALPAMLLSALAVKLEDRGPIFYRQRRVGEGRREFDMVKFRTMVLDADERLARGEPDERLLTHTGRLLRALHMNELPQLFQVLRGEMSLVGPRPEPLALVEEIGDLVPFYRRRGLVKPGLTGWAQVRCGYASSHHGTAWKMCHDLYYIKHRSVTLDLLILAQTAHALLERGGKEQLPAKDFILGEDAAVSAGLGETAEPAPR